MGNSRARTVSTASAETAIGANRLLFVTNTGSNTLSVFRVRKRSLELVSTADTNGLRPLSVTVHEMRLLRETALRPKHPPPSSNGPQDAVVIR